MTFRMPFLPPEATTDEASLLAFAEQATLLARQGDVRRALALALQARMRAQDAGSLRGEAAALGAAAMVHLVRGDAIAAIAAALDAAPLAASLRDRSLAGHVEVSARMASVVLGAGLEAACPLRKVIEQAVAARDASLEIRARVGVGVVLGDAGRFAAAAQEFDRALGLSRRHPCYTSPARVTANQANLHRKEAAWDAAIVVAERACRLARGEGSAAVEIDALAIAGCARVMRGDHAIAGELLERSVAIGRARRARSSTLWVLCEWGELLLGQGDVEGAGRAFQEAYEIATDVRPSRKIATACEGLARVADLRGKDGEARYWREMRDAGLADFAHRSEQARRELEARALAA